MWPFVYKHRLLKTHDYLLLFYPLNFIHSSARQNILVLTVNIVGIPTCSQHLLTWFVRRPDDGHVRIETCSLTHNKIWCVWRKLLYYFSIKEIRWDAWIGFIWLRIGKRGELFQKWYWTFGSQKCVYILDWATFNLWSSLIWDVMQRWLVVKLPTFRDNLSIPSLLVCSAAMICIYWRFGTTIIFKWSDRLSRHVG